jgi:hypothetical protein
MSFPTGWVPDPYGVHEFRFFSADGKPTRLVQDGEKKSHDEPPMTNVPPTAEPTVEAEYQPVPPPHSGGGVATASGDAPRLDSGATAPRVEVTEVRIPMPQTDTAHELPAPPQSPATDKPLRSSVPPVIRFSGDEPREVAEGRHSEPVTQAQKVAYGVVFGVLALSLLGLAYVHLRTHPGSQSKSAVRTTTPTRVVRTTTTTAAPLPAALQPGAEAAATALVSNWATQNRTGALSVATPAAVTALFAEHYAAGLAVDRGCSTSFVPIVCTFGPPGGASPTDPIYQISVSQTAGGWYVSSVKVENTGSGSTSSLG